MSIKIIIYSTGKTKESWLKEAIAEYEKRLSAKAQIQWILTKDQTSLLPLIQKEKSYHCLDPQGKLMTSESFSKFFCTLPSKRVFVIGDAEGMHPTIIQGAKSKISLSKLTFTHQMTRLIFIEQIYRAIKIEEGSSYHK